MHHLFEESTICGMALKNRFVRSATWEGLAAEDGSITPKLAAAMAALAEGGVGLIISSHAYVSREGQATPWQIGIYKDDLIPGLRQMTAAVHDGGGKIMAQLAHAGHQAPDKITGRPAVAVSASEALAGRNIRVATKEDIEELVAGFARAASRAKAAGFDGIEIHSGHGYLLSQFLSPAFNKRRDAYGGDIVNRTAVHLDIYRAVREIVGRDYPIFIKMNCADFTDNGLTGDDGLAAAKRFAEAGFDAIEVSGGILGPGKLTPSRPGIASADQEAYHREYAVRIKSEISTPLILVGGLRSFEVAEEIVARGDADYIALSRPLICEPGLIGRWQKGDLRKAECVSDNLCFKPGFTGKGIYCVTREKGMLKGKG